MINKGTFAYSITNIDDDLICEFAPKDNKSFRREKKNKRAALYLLPVAAVAGIMIIIVTMVSSGLLKSPIGQKPGQSNVGDSSAVVSDTESAETDNYLSKRIIFSPIYLNLSDDYYFVRVKPVKNCGVFYYGYKGKPLKCVVFEAKVIKDYYDSLEEGETLHVLFMLDYPAGPMLDYPEAIPFRFISIDEEKFVDCISKMDSFIFYTWNDRSLLCLYETEELGKRGEKETVYEDLCYCKYADYGIIPIVDSKVDYTGIDSVFDLNDFYPFSRGNFKGMSTFFIYVNTSPDGIRQGDSIETVTETIKKLIKQNYIGGFFKNEKGEYIFKGHRSYRDRDFDPDNIINP